MMLGYPSFSHFLELRHQPQSYPPSATSRSPPPLLLYSTVAAKLPPPADSGGDSSGSPGPVATAPITGKNFTIDAILGLQRGKEDRGVGLAPTDLSTRGGGANPQSGAERSGTQYGARRTHDKGCDVLSSGVSKKPAKSKRVRTIFTPEQLERLEAEFERQQYMVGPERLYLAHALQLTEAQVKVWFQNRRIKWRKQHLELQQQRLAALKHQQQLQHQHMEDSELESNSGDEGATDTSFPTPLSSSD